MKKIKTLLAIMLLIAGNSLTAQIAVNDDAADPDGSAMLDIQSSNKGLLPPRMTQAQIEAIINPANALMVYNTDDGKFYIFILADNEWKEIEFGTGTLTPNTAPVASNVNFSGALVIGETLTGSYTYSDGEGDLEGTSTFQWYRADDDAGTNQVAISGASALTYNPVTADLENFITFEVTPVALTGISPGAAVMSPYQEMEFGSVYNPTTGRTWLDRNLGASQVATSSDDPLADGNLYQWGRAADGHEIRTSGTTSTNATTAVPNAGNPWDGLFITETTSPLNWLIPPDNTLWQGVGGTNNPCPNGFRLPTEAEFEAERLSWVSNDQAGAFASPLKLTVCGVRNRDTGSLGWDTYAYYWTSTIDGNNARLMNFGPTAANTVGNARSRGLTVRCIKE